MSEPTIWWVLAGAVVIVELMTGTFYLLMVAVGLIAAALAAQVGSSTTIQILTAALCGSGAVIILYLYKKTRKVSTSASTKANQSASLDIGETVQVDTWMEDGTCLVKYRGSIWSALLAHGDTRLTGPHRIVEIIGSRLIIKKL